MTQVPRYDRFMLLNKIGRDQLLRRYFSPDERWCWVAGVLGTAADSPIRGWLLLTEKVPATVQDFAEAAGVEMNVAESTIQKAEEFGMVEPDDMLNCLWIPDWEVYNPKAPRADKTRNERQARHRAHKAQTGESNAEVTDDVTLRRNAASNGGEVSKEVRKEEPPKPPVGGRERDHEQYREDVESWVRSELPDLATDDLRVQILKTSFGSLRGGRCDVTAPAVREHALHNYAYAFGDAA